MLDIRQLRYFVVVAETLHFGRAAARLHMSQPPLSRHIAMLEKELGVALFERTSRRVVLTAAGVQLLSDARKVLVELDEMPGRAKAASRGITGEVKVGFTMYAANSVLPGLVRRFREAYPAVEIILREELPQELNRDLLDNDLDLGITIEGEADVALETRRLWEESLCAAIPADHPCANRAKIQLSDLSKDDFILVSRDTTHVLHDMVLASCRSAGFSPNVILETHLQQTIINLVAEGLSVALVPDSMRKIRMEGLVYVPLKQAPKIRQVMVWPTENRNPSALAMRGLATGQD